MALDKLKKIRKDKGFTQEEFSQKIKVSLKTYRNYEQGLRQPKPQMLKLIAESLGCKIDDFI